MKNKKILSILMASTLLFLSACSAGNSTKDSSTSSMSNISGSETTQSTSGSKDTLVVAVDGDPKVINPLYADDRVTLTIMNAIYSPFYIYDANGSRFYLAESLEKSDDYKTFTLKLKKDLKWSDGKPLTSDDVIFTLDSIMDDSQNSSMQSNLMVGDKKIKYEKVDDLTVKFTSDEPNIAFESNFENIRPIPKHVFEGEKDIKTSAKNEKPVSSGSYVIDSIVSGDSVNLVKNDNYSLGTPSISKLTYKILGDPTARKNALKTGEVDAASVTANDVDELKDAVNINPFEEGRLHYLVYKENNDALKNVNVRKAISYAINRDELIKGAYKSEDYAEKAYSILAKDTLFVDNTTIEKYDYNVEKAKELLSKENVKDLKLRLAYKNTDQVLKAIATIVQQRLQTVGITVELMPLESGAFVEKLFDLSNKDFDMCLNGYIMGKDPSAYKSLYVSSGEYNYINYSNSEVDSLFAKGDTITDLKEREENYKNIQKILADDAAIYPISYPKAIVATNKNLSGIDEARTIPIYMFEDLSKLTLK